MARKSRHKSKEPSIEIKTSFWDKFSRKTRHLFCVAFLFLLPMLIFSEVIISGKQYMAHDTVQWRAAAETLLEHQEETGEIALWATNMFGGMPAYVIYYPKTFTHLDTILFNTFRPYFPLVPYWVLLGGLYFMFWVMGFRPLASVAGAIIVSFTAYIPIIIGAGHVTKYLAYCFIPWVLAGYHLTTRGKYPLLGLFVMAMALNFTLRANHPQVLYYFLYVLLIWWLFDLYNAWKNGELPAWVKKTAFVMIAGIAGIVANAQPYLGTYDYAPHSIRGGSDIEQVEDTGGLDLDYAFAWSQGRAELLTLLVPEIFGGSSATGTYWGPKSFTSGPHYFGAIAFVLFLIGLLKFPGRLKFVFLASGVLTMLFSLGENLFFFNKFFFDFAPFYNKFRTPEMWLIATVFSFSIISVMGFQYLLDTASKKIQTTFKDLMVPLGIVLGVAVLLGLLAPTLMSYEKPGERQQIVQQIAQQQGMSAQNQQVQQAATRYIDQQLTPARADKASSSGTRFFFLVVLAGGLVLAVHLRKLPFAYGAIGIVILMAYDMLSVGHAYADKSGLIPKSVSMQDAIEQRVGELDRFIANNVASGEGWDYRALPLGDNPFNNAVPSTYLYPSIGGYTGAKLRNIQNVIDFRLFEGPAGINTEFLSMMNVKYLSYPQPVGIPGFEIAYEGRNGVILENMNVLPRAFFADSLITAESPQQALNLLGEFDPANTAVVENRPLPEVQFTENRNVQITEYGPNRIDLRAETDQPSFIVLSEIWYPAGWNLYLNEEPADLYKTNYLLRGIAIPEGTHEISLRLEPRSHVIGTRITFITNILLLLFGGFVLYGFYRKPSETNQ